jgi:two-component system sensor histidine kinase KdpD
VTAGRRELLHLGASLAAIAAVLTVLRVLGVTNQTTVALLMLVTVLATATVSRLWVAVISSIAAMLALNFFYMPPVGMFTIADPQNWIALFVFLAVAWVATRLMAERTKGELMRQKADLASTLLASLGHDLRTPLTAIGLAVENLQDGQAPPAQRREQGRLAIAELERLKRLFRDILDMARIDANALTIERDWVTPADIVDAAVSNLRPTLDHRVLDIEADAGTSVFVDPRLTSAALSHLIENALQYSPPDQPIELRGSVDADGLRLTVRDHGEGLHAAEIDQLFERFFRGRSAGRHLGAGMGLAITRGLLSAEGGRVSGRNAEGGGAEFTLFVPGTSHAVTAGQDT